jgi:hypothetical protein
MTELLVGTKKGLFALQGEPGGAFELSERAFAGEPVEYALRDARSGRVFASVTSPFYGPKLWHSDDVSGEWQQAEGLALPQGGDTALERIWVIVPGEQEGTLYAGGDPGVLFESRDGGASFSLNRPLFEHPTRSTWQPGAGGMCLHSIVTWPGEPDKLAIGISAAASLAALPRDQVHRLLSELAHAHLVTEHVPGRFGVRGVALSMAGIGRV